MNVLGTHLHKLERAYVLSLFCEIKLFVLSSNNNKNPVIYQIMSYRYDTDINVKQYKVI